MTLNGRFYAPGEASGVALVLSAPLSFWGGVDVDTGDVIDHSHPERGGNVSGRILVMPGARGSSSSSSVLAETIRLKTGPVGIILGRPDAILTVGCLVARSIYGLSCPLVVGPIEGMATGDRIRISRTDEGGARIDIAAGAVPR